MDLSAQPGYVPGFPDTLGLRELGGLRAADGRRVRHGLIYRGSALVDLTVEQRSRIEALGLRLILDLRASGEVEGRADYVPEGVDYLLIPGMYDRWGREVDFSPAGIGRMSEDIAASPGTFMRELYVSMMFGNPAVHALVDCLVEGRAPLLFHCTAGKDRTGVCAAAVLMALGVPDKEIVREFLLTNEYRSSIINMAPEDMPAWLTDEEREMWAAMNGVSAHDLRAALEAVDQRHATREQYFEQEFGLGARTLGELRARCLE